jgi:hypothetical protein
MITSSVFTKEEPMTYQQNLQDIQIMVEKSRKKIRNFQTAAAPSPDKIRPALLQDLEKKVAPILTIIFRKSLDTRDVALDWSVRHTF